MKRFFILVLCVAMIPAAFFAISCKKTVKYLLHGAVFNKCGEPMANSTIEIRQRGTAYYTKATSGGPIGTVKTDGSGNFSFEYKALKETDSLAIFDGTGNDAKSLMTGIPANSNEHLFVYRYMKLDMHVTTSGIVVVGTNDSMYTYHDSLVVGGEHIYYGAFRNGQDNGTFTIEPDVSHYNYLNKDYSLIWGIGWTNYIMHYITYKHYNEGFGVVHYKIDGCDGPNKVDINITGL